MLWNGLELPNSPYYQDDAVIIYHADCRDILPLIPDKSIDLVLTDPPYEIGKADWDIFDTAIFDECKRVLKEGCAIFTWFSQYKIGYMQAEIEKRFNLKSIIAEKKNNMVMTTWDKDKLQIQWEPIFYAIKGDKARIRIVERAFEYGKLGGGDVWEATVPQSNFTGEYRKQHPCQKDIAICNKAILLQSNSGDIILDPYLGSGTILRSAYNLSRKCIGIEIEEKYCEIAAKRCSQSVMRLIC